MCTMFFMKMTQQNDTFEQLKHFITNKKWYSCISEKLNIRRRTPRIAHSAEMKF